MHLPVLMGHEECAAYVTAIGICAFSIENLPIMFVVVQINSAVKGKHYDLGNLQETKTPEIIFRNNYEWRKKTIYFKFKPLFQSAAAHSCIDVALPKCSHKFLLRVSCNFNATANEKCMQPSAKPIFTNWLHSIP